MNWKHSFHAFDFDNEAAFDNEVDSIRNRNRDTLIHDWKFDLMLEPQACLGEFVIQTGVVRFRVVLDQARNELSSLRRSLIDWRRLHA